MPASASPSIEYDCELCHDQGWVYPRNKHRGPDYSRMVRCRCQVEGDRMEFERNMAMRCTLPSVSGHMTLGGFKVRKSNEAAHKAATGMAKGASDLDFHGWLILLGGVDQGKTHLAIAIAREWLRQGRAARYIFVPLLLDQLRANIGKNDNSFERDYNFFLDVPLLVMDDLGAEKLTEWAQERLEVIVDTRYVNGRPLVITTNKPLNELPVRINSRIQRYEWTTIVALEGKEYRIWKEGRC